MWHILMGLRVTSHNSSIKEEDGGLDNSRTHTTVAYYRVLPALNEDVLNFHSGEIM
jgi:hypothetical protein